MISTEVLRERTKSNGRKRGRENGKWSGGGGRRGREEEHENALRTYLQTVPFVSFTKTVRGNVVSKIRTTVSPGLSRPIGG